MNVYVTKLNGAELCKTMQFRQGMIADIAHQIGCREMGIYRYNGSSESIESLNGRLDGIIAGIQWGEDVVVCQFPTGNGFKFEWELIKRLQFYRSKVVIFIHDAEEIACESNLGEHSETIRLYNQAEVLIVPSVAMRQFLLEHGIRNDMKFVIQEMWDYIVDTKFINAPQLCKEIHVTDIAKICGVDYWDYSLPLKLYENSEIQGENVHHIKELSQGKLVSELSKGGFGLVWYQDAETYQGMEYTASFAMARYLAAGIPVIVHRGISIQNLIERNQLGLIVDSLDEVVAKVETITEREYRKYIQNVGQFAPALRNGYYMKKCLVDAVQAIYRKDVGERLIPAKVYDPRECAFTYAVLKESFEGNLALSWDYQGEADGFLIYDLFGKLVYETRNEHQHYFLIKGYGKENGFVIKAYIDTLKGKMIITKSEPTYLYEEQYECPRVSMIIPAYNAENYIVRAVDTVLAQSFPDLEVIIVDDGSADQTSHIVDWYAERYSNVAVIHKENGGVASARNEGIEYACGEYVGFLDCDDMIRPNMVERLYHSAKTNNCDIAVTSVYRIEVDGYKKFIQYELEEDTVIKIDDFLWMHFKGYIFSVSVWNKLYRSSLVKGRMFPRFFIGEDGAWTPYILSYAERLCYLNDRSYEYDRTIRDSTLEDQWRNISKQEQFMCYKNIVTFYLEKGNPKRMAFLRELAKWNLIGWGKIYAYDEYEKLWKKIEEKSDL